MELVKLLLPVITFVLGILSTLYVKRWDHEREVLRRNVDEICKLSEEWVNRLVQLSIFARIEENQRVLDENLSMYSHGSLFLAKYRQALEVLKQSERYRLLVLEAEELLALFAEHRHVQDVFNSPDYALCGMQCLEASLVEEVRPYRTSSRRLVLLPHDDSASKKKRRRFIPMHGIGGTRIHQQRGIDLSDRDTLADLHVRVQRMRILAAEVVS